MTEILRIESDILEGLARYRYLALPHMLRLRGVKTDKETREALRKLVLAKMVGERQCGPVPGLGRLPSCYWLTAKGADAFREISGGEKAPYPAAAAISLRHLPHRYLLLHAMIGLDLWARETGQTVERFGTYFTATATHLKKLGIKPDGLAVLRGLDGTARPYLLEASRGEYDGGVRHGMQTLMPYLAAFAGEGIDIAVWGDEAACNMSAVRLLMVYDSEASREAVLTGIRKLPSSPAPDEGVWARVFTKNQTQVLQSFGDGWISHDGQNRALPDGLGGDLGAF